MKICLAGNYALKTPKQFVSLRAPFVLQTYWDMRNYRRKQPDFANAVVHTPQLFILDSGAFTFQHGKNAVDWEAYCDEYSDFIRQFGVKRYIEMDVDHAIGYDSVKSLRNRIEAKTGVQAIPVFHKARRMQEYRAMCRDYEYIAIGASGLTNECKWVHNKDILRKLIEIAHENGCKVHGLGYTRLENINNTTVPFDSVDSSSCMSGGRFGTLYKFTGDSIKSTSIKGRVKDVEALNTHNIGEWIKMSKYKEGLL